MLNLITQLFITNCFVFGFFNNYESKIDPIRLNELTFNHQINSERLEQLQSKVGYGIEIIVADRTLDSLPSVMGHSAIRFVGSGENPLDDFVISLEMHATYPSEMFIKAFTGGFEVLPTVYTVLEYINHYQVNQGRKIQRMPLPSFPQQRSDLAKMIKTMLEVPDLFEDYNFITNNCTTLIYKLLSASGYTIYGIGNPLDVPVDLFKKLQTYQLSPYPEIDIPSATEILFKELKIWHMSQDRGFNRKMNRKNLAIALTNDQFWAQLLNHTSDFEKQVLLHLWPSGFLDKAMSELELSDAEQAKNIAKYANELRILSKSISSSKMAFLEKIILEEFIKYQNCEDQDQNCRIERLNSFLTSNQQSKIIEIIKNWEQSQLKRELLLHRSYSENRGELFYKWRDSANVMDNMSFYKDILTCMQF